MGNTTSIKLVKPPRTDRARWMVYAINVLMIWLCQDCLELTPSELNGVREISKFTRFIYAEPWFRSPFFQDVAFMDLHMMKNLDSFEK